MSDTENIATQTEQSGPTKQVVPISKLWWVGLIALLVASIGSVIFFFITKSLFDIPYIIPLGGPDGPLGLLPIPAIFILSGAGTIGATILLAILGKFVSRPFRMFWIISFIVFLLSFILPVTLPDTVAMRTVIGLGAMHVIGLVLIVGILTMMGRKK
ncbi:MAG: hypothetical protein IH946_07930 [Bacteroidetes bacterium]|nr:hypothetical protein [Bacteroidota bacterium]